MAAVLPVESVCWGVYPSADELTESILVVSVGIARILSPCPGIDTRRNAGDVARAEIVINVLRAPESNENLVSPVGIPTDRGSWSRYCRQIEK